jgi:uncharacterized SAM-binding protein YcdF (DUF218 family)
MPRTDPTQLPGLDELSAILAQEAQRPVFPGKANLHYPHFELAISWLNLLGLDSRVFSADLPWQEVITDCTYLENKVISKTLDPVNQLRLATLFPSLTDYLGETDVPRSSSLIYVFGSQNLSRIQTAVNLWKENLAPLIFITGGHPHYQETPSEAEIFKNYALSAGVPESSLIIEPQAITVADNVRRGLNLLDSQSIKFDSLITVTAWFSQRRSWSHLIKYIPDIPIYRVNSPVKSDGDFAPNRWFANSNGIKVIYNEFVKMKTAVSLNTA